MSTQSAASLVPVLDGTNYGIWSKAMKAYLMSLGLWSYVNGTIQEPQLPANPTPEQGAAYLDWTKQNNMAMGNIVLRVNASIQQEIADLAAAETQWNRLLTKYGTPTITGVFRDFKEALNIRLKTDGHPGNQIDRMAAAFQRCAASSISVPEQLQAMILLAAMPPKWEMLVAIVTQNYDLADIEFKHVRETILAQYETEATCNGRPKGNKPQDANKLSAVKRKRGNPNFSNQEKGSSCHRRRSDND